MPSSSTNQSSQHHSQQPKHSKPHQKQKQKQKHQNHNHLHIDTALSARDIAPQSVSSSNKHEPSPHSLAPTPSTTGDSFHDARTSHDPNESFLDTQTPVDADMADQRLSRVLQRDSHDLSLNPRNVTRDSLVTNMLMSLDQFSITRDNSAPQYDEDDDSPRFFDVPRYRSNNDLTAQSNDWQGRGHGHQHSYSSDIDSVADDSSRKPSRGRRSNSSTAYNQDAYSRLNSARPPPSRGNHARGGRGSKSSSVTSLEQPQANSNGRSNKGFSRSASFDERPSQSRAQAYPQLEDVPQSPFKTDFIHSFLNDDLDAAPTPTVPGGPRRTPSTPTTAKAAEPTDRSSSFRNRSTSRSVKSSAGRGKAQTREPAPPMPSTPAAVDLESAPAPAVGYGKPKAASPAATPVPKERPGFFKRVFGGGSSKTSTPALDSNRSSRLNNVEQGADSPSSNGMQTPNQKTGSAPPSRDTTSSHSNHPTLQKKSSSFFRRRKKSSADQAPPVPSQTDAPPVPPISTSNWDKDKEQSIPKPEPSPVSSLRQVMNPYLRETAASPNTPRKETAPLSDITNTPDRKPSDQQEYKREFSPDYEPSPNARIRKVRSTNLETSRTEETTAKPSGEPRNNSFLNLDNGSDNDDDATPTKKRSSRQRSKTEGREPGRDDTLRPRKKKSSKRLPIQVDSPVNSNLTLPMEGAKRSGSASPRSTQSGTPDVRVESLDKSTPKALSTVNTRSLDEPETFVVGEPTEDDRSKAQKIYDGNEDFISKEKAAAWMGEEGPIRQRTLQAYIELYDFANQSIVYSLRQLCGRLIFRAETQQMDRILVAFSKRWCECNPNHGFKATGKFIEVKGEDSKLTWIDVIHTICYSIMLLNTDLHMADIEQNMTRSQFVKNTMGTITQAVTEAAPDAFERRPSMLTVDEPNTPTPTEERKSFRHSFRPPPRVDSQVGGEGVEDCGPLVKSPHNGSKKSWEEQVEIVLKGIYTSIRDERLPLFGADPVKSIPSAPSQSSLSVMGMLKRTPSVLSKAPSEGNLSVRGRVTESRGTTSRWTSKSRSRPAVARAGFNSSRTSFDDGNSMWSPAMSSSATWSRQSLGRTQPSISQDSFGSAMPRGDYQQSIGFANALSQAIIRDEENEGAPSILSQDMSSAQLLEDESLEITGPPWVKEGMVIHKHHLDGVDKKAKERNWSEVFAVLQKGQMSLFSFTANKSQRQKSRSRAAGPVGGGNWQDNATNVGSFSLRQTLASALPPPGYSRTRPHVWALSLPTGAVHLFQVGTPELIKEFVTTANYWSARLSTHPLIGGISNIEYGWSDSIVNNALVSAINDTPPVTTGGGRPSSSATHHGRKSSVSSFRSASIDQAAAAFTNATGRGKLPGDRIHIASWAPPSQSLRPSNAPEHEQLETLQAYVKSIGDELETHNQLRSPMLLAFTPRGHNAGKAMANWERKSAYLLREIVKFRTYVDCLTAAEARKQEIYAERELAQRAARGELSDGEMEVSGSEDGDGDVTLKP